MKVKRLLFIPGGMPQFWKGQEERRSRLEASDGKDQDSVAVEMELMLQLGGYIRLMYGGKGPFYIGPHMVLGIVPLEETAPSPKEPAKK